MVNYMIICAYILNHSCEPKNEDARHRAEHLLILRGLCGFVRDDFLC